jgi:hypothetical protein
MIRRSLAESTQCAELAILLADDRFLEYLYAALPSWGMTKIQAGWSDHEPPIWVSWSRNALELPGLRITGKSAQLDPAAISPLGILVLGNRRAVLDFAEYAPKSA